MVPTEEISESRLDLAPGGGCSPQRRAAVLKQENRTTNQRWRASVDVVQADFDERGQPLLSRRVASHLAVEKNPSVHPDDNFRVEEHGEVL